MNNKLFLGADAGGTGLKFVVTSAEGQIVAQSEVPTDPDSPAVTLDRLATAVGATSLSLDDVQGVGLACAGIVDPGTGSLGRSPNLPGWEGANLRDEIQRVFGSREIALANDVNAALFGEHKAGAGRGCRNLIMIALGTGVGGGILLDGKLIEGVHYGAGEIGHMVLDPQGPACTCGGTGCLEAWAGSVGLLRNAATAASSADPNSALRSLIEARGDKLTTRDLSRLAEEGDADCTALFDELGERLGQAVGNLVNTLDPDRILIGGGLAQAGDLFLDRCRSRVADQVLAEGAKKIPIVSAELGPHAAAVGAAWLVRESEPNS